MQQWGQQIKQGFGGMRGQSRVWIREIEHVALRLIALFLSLSSAHAIRWFFSPLDGADVLMPYINWVIAGSVGVLGFFVSRGLAHRMMNKESAWLYAPVCIAVEFIEIFCNYALAASMIAKVTWLASVPDVQRHIVEFMTYAVLSSIPLLGMLLAVVDMDMIRKRAGGGVVGRGQQPKAVNPSSWQQQPAGQGYTQQGGYTGSSWQQQPAGQAPGGSQNGAPLPGVARP